MTAEHDYRARLLRWAKLAARAGSIYDVGDAPEVPPGVDAAEVALRIADERRDLDAVWRALIRDATGG